MKEYGNRRSEEELAALTIKANAAAYELEKQPDFKGTEEELERMQAFERAYIDGYPIISDEEWDILKKRFNYKESLTAGSPSGRTWIKMQAPLPSIEKVDSIEGLEEFIDRFPGATFVVEPKFDGLTANVIYKRISSGDYVLETITSRGNGRYGLQLNPYALFGVDLRGVPRFIKGEHIARIASCSPEYFEIRGEAVIHKPSYIKTHNLSEEESKQMVWRSIVSGIFNRKLPMNLEGLVFTLYHEELHDLLMDNNGVWHCENIANARLIASLTPDQHRFLKTSKLRIERDESDGKGVIIIEHLDGDRCFCKPAQERVDIISYSFGYNSTDNSVSYGVNFPLRLDCTIPGIIHASQVKLENGENTPIYTETDNIEEIISIIGKFYGANEEWKRDNSLPRLRNMHEYAMDGVVIKLGCTNSNAQALQIRNNRSNKNRLVIPKYPNDAVAVKLLSEIVRVKLMRIEHSKTTLNNVTCQGILDKPYLTESGAMVTNINLHNPSWLRLNNWIKEGQEYDMCMSLDIIPVLLPPPEIV